MPTINELRKTRLKKLETIKRAGILPFPAKTKRTHKIAEGFKDFVNLARSKKEVILAGRIRSLRGHGGSVFSDIEDGSTSSLQSETNKIQAYFKKDRLGERKYNFFLDNFDIGDFIEVRGILFKTKKEEKTIEVTDYKMLTKALLPLPEKWHGLKDEEERYRKRYLDILMDKNVKEIIEKKAIFWNAVREFHVRHGFVEVETPVLENTTGGADANPFITYHNSLGMNVYLRISAGELWQKRLMVAGFEKTFEIGRIFRNEGMSVEHLQDYTQCEAYWAYGDYKDMYKFLQECYCYVAKKTFGTLKFKIRGFNIDLGKKTWPLIDYAKEIKKQTNVDIWKADEKAMNRKLKKLGVKFDGKGRGRLIDSLWKYCRKQIGGPAILINEPKIISPIAKSCRDNIEITERFHFIVAGSEVGQGYSELNDPIDQKERFEKQQALRDAGDKEAQMADYEFVEALEYGMPPACGHGFSERLFSFLIDKSIRECQIFPLMKPKKRKA